jgi:hypothetical protein
MISTLGTLCLTLHNFVTSEPAGKLASQPAYKLQAINVFLPL